MGQESEKLQVGTVASARRHQVFLVLLMLFTLAFGAWLHSITALGVQVWLTRAGLIVVGMTVSAGFLNDSYGWFNGSNSRAMWSSSDQPIAKSFSLILLFGSVGGTLVSALADLGKVGT